MPMTRSMAKCASAFALVMLLSPMCRAIVADEATADLAGFRREVQPVLNQLCVGCHGPDKQEADLRLDTLDPDLAAGPDAETWHDVLNKLNLGEMPPEKAKPLSEQQRRTVVGWLTREMRRAAQLKRSTGGQVVLRRLTRYEYNNTLRDLLGVNLDFVHDLPPEPPSADGFQNNGASLGISPLQVELYLEAARKGLQKAIVLGDKPQIYTHRAEKSGIRHGQCLRYDAKTPLANLFVTMLDRLGVPVDSFADSTGELSELLSS